MDTRAVQVKLLLSYKLLIVALLSLILVFLSTECCCIFFNFISCSEGDKRFHCISLDASESKVLPVCVCAYMDMSAYAGMSVSQLENSCHTQPSRAHMQLRLITAVPIVFL